MPQALAQPAWPLVPRAFSQARGLAFGFAGGLLAVGGVSAADGVNESLRERACRAISGSSSGSLSDAGFSFRRYSCSALILADGCRVRLPDRLFRRPPAPLRRRAHRSR